MEILIIVLIIIAAVALVVIAVVQSLYDHDTGLTNLEQFKTRTDQNDGKGIIGSLDRESYRVLESL